MGQVALSPKSPVRTRLRPPCDMLSDPLRQVSCGALASCLGTKTRVLVM